MISSAPASQKSDPQRLSALMVHWVGPWPKWFFLVIGYCVLHLVLRLSLSESIAVDDVVEVVFTQSLSLGYDPKQPPLYTWLLWGFGHIGTVSLVHILLLKYSLLIVTLVLLRDILLRLTQSASLAGLGSLSLLLLYQLGWNIHEGVTHTLTIMVCVALTLWQAVRLIGFLNPQQPSSQTRLWLEYGLFGIILAAGFYSKYSYPLFLSAFFLAALGHPRTRSILIRWEMLFAFALALFLLSPYVFWLLNQPDGMSSLQRTAEFTQDKSYFANTAYSLWKLVTASLGFLTPLLPILIILRPRLFHFWSPQRHFNTLENIDWERFFGRLALICLLLLAFAALFGLLNNVKARWMHPFLLPALPWLWLRLHRLGWRFKDTVRLFVILLAISGLIFVMRAGRLGYGPPFCGKCRAIMPYEALETRIKALGFTGGMIIAQDEHLAGNLRVAFPQARLLNLHKAFYHPPARDNAASYPSGQCLMVWHGPTDQTEQPQPPLDMLASLKMPIENIPPGHIETLTVTRQGRLGGPEISAIEWSLGFWPEGLGPCQ